MTKIKAGVVGASGYAGISIVSILLSHPFFQVNFIGSDAYAGKRLIDIYPRLKHVKQASSFIFQENEEAYSADIDAIFLATPHTVSMNIAHKFLERGITVIDLSGDFRLKDEKVFEKWYGKKHSSAELLNKRAFGLPELFEEDLNCAKRQIEDGKAPLISCAGCYVTASSLAAYPLITSQYFDSNYYPVIDAISGYTGAGKNPGEKGLFVNAGENAECYKIFSHRHKPEIEQILQGQNVIFTPHLAPMKRGILSTVTAKLKNVDDKDQILPLYKQKYNNSEFVQVLEEGEAAKTGNVIGTNNVEISINVDEEGQYAIIVCAIDNLIKGAAGQAVQCANIIYGFQEDCGLENIYLPI